MRELEVIAQRLRASTVKVQRRRSGGGSGVIWRSTGLIVTNAHVAPGPQATVRLADENVLTGTVTARDYEHDLAALRVFEHQKLASPHAIVMHCLPAAPDAEIGDDVKYGNQSRIFRQAHNRLHVQKGLLAVLFNGGAD